MSRQTSPAQHTPQPGQQHSHYPARAQHPLDPNSYTHNHLDSSMSAGPGPTFVVGMPPQPVQTSASTSSARGKGKGYASGFTASTEDVKYATKYRDLKKKVKEIEADNDKLYFKVMQAKRNIQRAKLERAILYERLGTVPASPPPGHAALPAHQLPGPVHGVVPPIVHPPPAPVPYEQHHRDARHNSFHDHPSGQVPVPPPERHSRAPHQPGGHPRKRAHHEMGYGTSPPPSPQQVHLPPPAQLPIEQYQYAVSIGLPNGTVLYVAADPDGKPIEPIPGEYIQVDPEKVPPFSTSTIKPQRRAVRPNRGQAGNDNREILTRMVLPTPGSGKAPPALQPPHNPSTSRSHSGGGTAPLPSGQMSPPISNARVPTHGGHHIQAIAPREPAAARERELELQREFEHERELRDRERERHERHDLRERERGRHAHPPPHGHTHGHHSGEPVAPPVERDRSRRHDLHELAGSPPPQNSIPLSREPLAPSPSQMSPTQGHTHAHRSHSMHSHQSHHSHHSHGHRSHSHSHSGSPMNSPTDSRSLQQPNNQRIHGHQRIGPGSNINRDYNTRDRDIDEREDRASPVSVTPTGAPGSSTSRVPTPPYMRTSTATGAAITSSVLPPRDNENHDVEMDSAEPLALSARPSSRDRRLSGTPS